MNQFYEVWSAITGNQTNFIFFCLIGFLGILAIFGTFNLSYPRISKFARLSPAILATLGIFGSFWGISVGLIGFDVNDIEASVPHLIDGLKVKFIASLIGIFFSIVVRICQSFALIKTQENIRPENITQADIYDVLRKLGNDNQEAAKNQLFALESIKTSLIGEIDGSLGTQLLKLRADNQTYAKQNISLLESVKLSLIGDGESSVGTQLLKLRVAITESLDEVRKSQTTGNQHNLAVLTHLKKATDSGFQMLIAEFQTFAQRMAENNSQALIDALQGVIRDFNDKIHEQFGENFKQLNQAVGALLHWQENYKTHVEQITERFHLALTGIELAQGALGVIIARSETFKEVAMDLQKLLSALDFQVQDLDRHLQAFGGVANQAQQIFPTIQNNVLQLTDNFKRAVDSSAQQISIATGSLSNTVQQSARLFEGTINSNTQILQTAVKGTGESLQQTVRATGDALQKSASDIASATAQQERNLAEAGQNFNATIDQNLKTLAGTLKETVSANAQDLQAAVKGTGESLQQTVRATGDALQKSVSDIASATAQQERNLAEAGQNFNATIDQNLKTLAGTLKETVSANAQDLQAAVKGTGESLQQTVRATGDALQKSVSDIASATAQQERNLAEAGQNFNATIDQNLKTLAGILAKQIENIFSEVKTAMG
jgi:gas vesicle protein